MDKAAKVVACFIIAPPPYIRPLFAVDYYAHPQDAGYIGRTDVKLAFNDTAVLMGLIRNLENAVDAQNRFDATPQGQAAKAERQERFAVKKAAETAKMAARDAHARSRRLRGF